MFIDTHAHINFREYEGEIDDVLKRSFEAGVKKIINIGSNYDTSCKAVQMVEEANDFQETPGNTVAEQMNKFGLSAVIGCHPIHLTQDITESAMFDGKEYKFRTKKEIFDKGKYQDLIDDNKDFIVGIGETGLDYFHLSEIKDEKEIQKKVFREHIELALENDLPLVLHCRGSEDDPYRAYDEMLEIINGYKSQKEFKGIKGVIHCFVGNLKQAREFVDLGFYIGVNGIVTFKKSTELQEIVKEISLNKIVLETDCPFLSPEPYRGKRNEPMHIPVIAQKMAELKCVDIKMIEKITTQNSERLFGI